MSTLTLGIIVGVVLTLFCTFCLGAHRGNGQATDAELEAWQETWRKMQEEKKEQHEEMKKEMQRWGGPKE